MRHSLHRRAFALGSVALGMFFGAGRLAAKPAKIWRRCRQTPRLYTLDPPPRKPLPRLSLRVTPGTHSNTRLFLPILQHDRALVTPSLASLAPCECMGYLIGMVVDLESVLSDSHYWLLTRNPKPCLSACRVSYPVSLIVLLLSSLVLLISLGNSTFSLSGVIAWGFLTP